MTIDTERLKHDAAYWDEVAPDGATHCAVKFNGYEAHNRPWEKWKAGLVFEHDGHDWVGYMSQDMACERNRIPRPAKPEWVDGLPPESIGEFRKSLALNLQNAIEAITGEAFGDDESLILAHEMMVKYDLPDKLKSEED